MAEVAQAVESPAHGPDKPMVAADDLGPMQRAIEVSKLGPEVQTWRIAQKHSWALAVEDWDKTK